MSEEANQRRLSSAPLLDDESSVPDVATPRADVPPELEIQTQPAPEASTLPEPEASTQPPPPQQQASLQAQDSITSAAGAKVNPVKLSIYTLNEGVYCKAQFESGRLTTAQQVLTQVRENLGIPKDIEHVFSIWLTSKHLQLQLKSYHLPCKLFKRWKDLLSQFTTATYEEITQDEPILSFQRNAFLPLKEERNLLKKQDPDDSSNYRQAINLLYHEATFNTTRGRYPLTTAEFHSQAGLQAAIKHMEQGEDLAKLRAQANLFYPPHMRTAKSSSHKVAKLFKKSTEGKNLGDELIKSYEEASKKCPDPHQLKILYLQLCWHKPFYASVFFKGLVEKAMQSYLKLLAASEKQIIVAVNTECIHVMAASSPSDVLLYLTYDQLSWDFQPSDAEGDEFFSSLWLEFDSVLKDNKKVAKRLQIFSRQAPMIDAMITRCVAAIDKKEETLRQLRVQQGSDEFLEYNITTGCAQKQELNYKEDKLQCTILDPDGQATFTLSRIMKRKKSRDDLKTDASESTPLTPSRDVEMAPTADSEAAKNSPHSSDHSITTDV